MACFNGNAGKNRDLLYSEACSPTITARHEPFCVISLENDGSEDAAIDNTTQGGVAFGISSQASNSMKSDNPHSGIYEADVSRTLDTNGGEPSSHQGGILILSRAAEKVKALRRYIVRRLTPTECARLQGFPDDWGRISRKKEMTAEDIAFWEKVRETYAKVNGEVYAPKRTEKALRKWFNKLHSDSAEYEMWGNGVALPNVLYVLEGIREALEMKRCA